MRSISFLTLVALVGCLSPADNQLSLGFEGDVDSDADSDTDTGVIDTGDADTDSDSDTDTAIDTGSIDTGETGIVDTGDTGSVDTGVIDTGDADTDTDSDSDADSDVDSDTDVDTGTGPVDADGDGFYEPEYDCDDSDAAVNPGAVEVCDGIDNNCDGVVDEDSAADASTWYGDSDGDGYGEAGDTAISCSAPSGYVELGSDCDDSDADVNPGAADVCDSTDNDCDGAVDEDSAVLTWYVDDDGDGYGDSASTHAACSQPSGYVSDATDCDDGSASVNPGATETANGIDDDCDGSVDEGTHVALKCTGVSYSRPTSWTSSTVGCTEYSGGLIVNAYQDSSTYAFENGWSVGVRCISVGSWAYSGVAVTASPVSWEAWTETDPVAYTASESASITGGCDGWVY